MNRQVPNFWPYFGVIALDAVGFSMVGPILAPLFLKTNPIFAFDHLGHFGQYCLYGFLLAIFPLAYMIAAPLLGNLSDRYGRKPVLILCIIGMLGGWIGYYASLEFSSLSLLILGRILSGLTSANQAIAQAAIADLDSEPSQKARHLSLIAIAMSAGLVLGPLCTMMLAQVSHQERWAILLTFMGAILLSIVNLIVVLGFLKEIISPTQKQACGFLENSARLWRHPVVRRYLAVFFCFELGWSLYYQALPALLLVHFQENLAHLSRDLCIVGLLLCFQLWGGVRLGLRFFKVLPLTKLSLMIGFFGLAGAYCAHTLLGQALAATFITLSVAGGYTGLLTLLSDCLGEHQGLLMGYTDALLALAFAMTGLLAGVLASFSLFQPLLFAAIVMGISLLFLLLPKRGA